MSSVQTALQAGALAGGANASALAPIDHLLPLLVLLWCAGVSIVAARALHQWRKLARLARDFSHSSDELDALLAGLTRRFGFMRRIRVLVSRRIDTPMLIGWLKPVILLPTAVALGFPRQQIELILAHELGHLRRYDHLVNLAQALLETLLFYHPVVHWISREVRNERELCCDALVLRVATDEPREYARTLAALEELRQPSAQLALAANGGVLVERVRRIVGMPAPRLGVNRSNPMRWFLLAAFLTFAAAMVVRSERAGEARFVTAPGIDWLVRPDVRVVPMAALMLPFEHVRLHPAIIAPMPAARTEPVLVRPLAPAAPIAVVHEGHAAVAAAAADMKLMKDAASPAPVTAPLAVDRRPVEETPRPVAEASVSPVHPRAPVATRIVTPQFPESAGGTGRVDASFLIAADGSVQDIKIADDEAGGVFARVAARALQQWRFDPATLSGARSTRYRQSFVFAPLSTRRAAAPVEGSCVQPTGSHICRLPDEGHLQRKPPE
jgi:beta-lactamase regulating signal transducer with metallopeptidase domain